MISRTLGLSWAKRASGVSSKEMRRQTACLMGFIASVLLVSETLLTAGAFTVVFDGAGFPHSHDFNVFRSFGRQRGNIYDADAVQQLG